MPCWLTTLKQMSHKFSKIKTLLISNFIVYFTEDRQFCQSAWNDNWSHIAKCCKITRTRKIHRCLVDWQSWNQVNSFYSRNPLQISVARWKLIIDSYLAFFWHFFCKIETSLDYTSSFRFVSRIPLHCLRRFLSSLRLSLTLSLAMWATKL